MKLFVGLQQDKALIWVLIVSALLRLGVALALGEQVVELPGTSDQVSYHTLATRLLEGYGFTMPRQWWPITPAGEPTAHWSYLYTFYLFGVYALFGVHPLLARLIQALIAGLLMPWLAYRLSLRVFCNPLLQVKRLTVTPALLAAAWVGLYPYFLYYAGCLMTETFYMMGILWVLDCALRLVAFGDGRSSPGTRRWLELGLAIGLTLLLRQVFLVFVPFLFLWLLWAFRQQERWGTALRKAIVGGLVSGAVMALLIAPFTALNYHQFGRFVLLNTNAGYAFFWANHPVHGSHFVPLFTSDMPTYQDLIPPELRNLDEAALDQALLQRGLIFVWQDFGRFLLLSLSRIPAHFIFWPLPESSLPSNLTRFLSLGIALPFMIAGGLLWFREARCKKLEVMPGALLIVFILVYVGVHLLSWAGIRYRLPTDAVGLIFAAYAAWRLLIWQMRCRPFLSS